MMAYIMSITQQGMHFFLDIYFKLYFPEMLMLLPILLLASLEAFPVATWTESDRGPMIQPSLT